MKTPKTVLIIVCVSLLLLTVLTLIDRIHTAEKAGGSLELSQDGRCIYHDTGRDIKVSGYDLNGITYIFLPSFVSDDHIRQISEGIRIYLTDGTELNRARFGCVQDIEVDYGNGEMIPWKICFMRSENLPSVFLDLSDGGDISQLTREEYSDGVISVYDQDGNMSFVTEKIILKGRGNYTWQSDKKHFEFKVEEDVSL